MRGMTHRRNVRTVPRMELVCTCMVLYRGMVLYVSSAQRLHPCRRLRKRLPVGQPSPIDLSAALGLGRRHAGALHTLRTYGYGAKTVRVEAVVAQNSTLQLPE
jgi:hypothetical protein